MTSERSYPLSAHAWGAYRDLVTIKLANDTIVGYLPVAFIKTGGNDTWHFVIETMRQLVECDDRYPCELKDLVGTIMVLTDSPAVGCYTFGQPGVYFAR